MADTMSIQDRIAALNLGHVRTPGDTIPTKPSGKPALPPRPPARSAVTTQDFHINAEDGQQPIGNQPAQADTAPAPPQRAEKKRLPLPPPRPVTHEIPPSRRPSAGPPPLPSRNGSQTVVRRDSNESISSTISGRSSVSGLSTRTSVTTPSLDSKKSTFRVPSYDPTTLPALPPKQADRQQQRPALRSSTSAANVTTRTSQKPPLDIPPIPPPRRESTSPAPPPRPRRNVSQVNTTETATPTPQPQTAQRVSQPQRRSALSFGMNKEETPPPVPAARPEPTGQPPPIPTASRPNLAAIQASKPKPPFTGSGATTPAPAGVCLKCRDFSGPDNHAAKFPRESIPHDVNWLAESLTSPFPSHTDKARALFTWCHHNIAYNAADFFSGCLKGSTPQSTIDTGLAVCEGYAALFNAMALVVGLESVVLGGGSMGFGKKATGPNDPVPPEDASGHAWNVVRIDGGEWKLIDVCWGAGHINDQQQYVKAFNPSQFTMSNNQFGLKHYPKDPAQQFREDERIMGWEEFCRGGLDGGAERLTVYGGCVDTHGIDEMTIQPPQKHIRLRGVPGTQRVQFLFSSLCEHYDPIKLGKGRPYVYVLAVGGRDGRDRKNIPFRTNGRHWWLDLELRDLGCMGQSINLYAVTSIGGLDGHGLTIRDFEQAAGRKGMGFGGVAGWQLV